jgi:hypothetical protein
MVNKYLLNKWDETGKWWDESKSTPHCTPVAEALGNDTDVNLIQQTQQLIQLGNLFCRSQMLISADEIT